MDTNIFSSNLDRLARRMQRGDAAAADALYRELADKVFGFCMNRVSRREIAEDITQDIFLKLVDGIGTFDVSRGRFTVWFWQLARNTVIDYYRRGKDISFSDMGEPEVVEALAIEESPAFGDDKLSADRLKLFVKGLSPEEQELFRLRYVAELSYRDIVGVLGKSDGALRVAASRLKYKIRDHFKTHEI